MSASQTAARLGAHRPKTPSVVRVGITLAGLLAVTVAFGAWSSSRSTSPAPSAHAAGAVSKAFNKNALMKWNSADCKKDQSAGTITYVSPFGISAGIAIGPAVMAQDLGFYKVVPERVA